MNISKTFVFIIYYLVKIQKKDIWILFDNKQKLETVWTKF